MIPYFEIYPDGRLISPGESDGEPCRYTVAEKPSVYSSSHVLIHTGLKDEEIKALAEEAGWRLVFDRRKDLFNLWEFWLENRFMVEILTDEFLQELTETYPEQLVK